MKTDTLKCVILFDLDGTLITGPKHLPSAGLKAMNDASSLLTGQKNLGNPKQFAGRTDMQIAKMLLESANEVDIAKNRIDLLVNHYIDALAHYIKETKYSALGLPHKTIPLLKNAGATIGLGTGNIKRGAKLKLKSANLDTLFDIDKGGYGDDGNSRADLLEIGAKRCDPSRTKPVVIIGDTPRDIAAAHDIGAVCIGIPYHDNTASSLTAAGADAIADSVSPPILSVINSIL